MIVTELGKVEHVSVKLVLVHTWLIVKEQSEDVTGNSSDPQMRKVGGMIWRYPKAHHMRMKEEKDQKDVL